MKNIYLLFLLAIMLVPCSMQGQLNPIWYQDYQHTTTPGFSNESRKVATDSNGNIFVLSDVTSDFDPNGNVVTSPQHYTVILKYTPAGILDTSRQIYVINHQTSGFDNLGAFGLEIDQYNNVYVGYTMYNGISNYNVAVAKHNNNLVRQWTYTFNPSSIDEGVDLKVTPSGVVYALTKSVSGASTQYNIIKCDSAAGSSTVPLRAFDVNTEVLRSMVVDSNNDIFVTGYQLSNGFQSILTARVNIFGTLKWKRIYNAGTSNRNDYGSEIVLGLNQDCFIVGTSDRGTPFGFDGVVLKYTTGNGRFEWVSFLDYFNGTESGIAIDIFNPTMLHAGVVSGNKIITCRVETGRGQLTGRKAYEPLPVTPYSVIDSVSITELKSSVNNNVYLCGNVFAKDLSGQNFEADYLIKLVPVTGRFAIDNAFKLDAEIPVIGDHSINQRVDGMALHYGSNSLYSIQNVFQDYSLHSNEGVRLTAYNFPVPLKISGDASDTREISETKLFPNPVKSELNIFNTDGIEKVEIFDSTGKLVIEKKFSGESNLTLVVEGFAEGIYVVKITDLSGNYTLKNIIKQ